MHLALKVFQSPVDSTTISSLFLWNPKYLQTLDSGVFNTVGPLEMFFYRSAVARSWPVTGCWQKKERLSHTHTHSKQTQTEAGASQWYWLFSTESRLNLYITYIANSDFNRTLIKCFGFKDAILSRACEFTDGIKFDTTPTLTGYKVGRVG